MPKRSAQSKIEHYARKIRKIEEKEKRRRRIRTLPSSSEEEGNEEHTTVALQNDVVPNTEPATEPPDILQDTMQDDDQPTEQGPQEETAGTVEPDVDPDLLSALGESTSESPEYGENIHGNLSQLWLPLLRKGMPIEIKDKLQKEYLVPDNCRLLQAPKLNAEISLAVPDMVRNRDKTLTVSQQQLGLGITAVNRGMNLLLTCDDKVQAMKHLSNGCRILCDSHYLATQSRIKLITPSLDKAFLNITSESERDELLFGGSLSEKIKAAKTIEKQGLSLKKTPKAVPKPPQQPSNSRASYQGNWNPPPRYPANRGGRGAYRRPATATNRRSYIPTAPPPQRPATQEKPRTAAHNHR